MFVRLGDERGGAFEILSRAERLLARLRRRRRGRVRRDRSSRREAGRGRGSDGRQRGVH